MIKYGLYYDSFIHVCTVTIVPITLSCHLPTLTKPLPLLTSPPSFISSFFGDPLNEFSCHNPEENAPSALHPLTGLELQEEEAEQRCPLLAGRPTQRASYQSHSPSLHVLYCPQQGFTFGIAFYFLLRKLICF